MRRFGICSLVDDDRAGQDFEPSFLSRRPLTRRAFDLAAAAHSAQRRHTDDVPYVVHPLEAAALLHSLGFEDHVTAAAMLHDALEDTELTDDQIEAQLDDRVAGLVRALTEDAGIADGRERKAALRNQVAEAGPSAAAIFAADKLSKVRELRARLSRDPDAAQSTDAVLKLDHYRDSEAMLEGVLGEHPLVEQLRYELEALEALPPHGRRVE